MKFKKSKNKKVESERKHNYKEKFGDPQFILDEVVGCIRDGDFASITDLISAYISNSSRYSGQESFANKIGTTRQTLHRMFAHDNVSLTVFFGALEQIHNDAFGKDTI